MIFALCIACLSGVSTTSSSGIAMGINGHHFTQPNYMHGPLGVSSGFANGVDAETQLQEVKALAGDAQPFYYRLDIPCSAITSSASKMKNANQFIRSAVALNITVSPIILGMDLGSTAYSDHAAVTAATEASSYACAKLFASNGLKMYEIGQEWDNLALFPGTAGDLEKNYNATIYAHLLAELKGMAAGVRRASRESGISSYIGVNNGGWLHYAFYQMLIRDGLDFDFIGYHWYSEMGDINNAGGHNLWETLVSFGKDIWFTELDRRGGSSVYPVNHNPLDQAAYLDHEIHLLANLSSASGNVLKGIFVYELYDEPQQGGNTYPHTCSSGSAAVNGESCYGLLSMDWHAGPSCDNYPSCNFSAVRGRKPAWKVVHDWVPRLQNWYQ